VPRSPLDNRDWTKSALLNGSNVLDSAKAIRHISRRMTGAETAFEPHLPAGQPANGLATPANGLAEPAMNWPILANRWDEKSRSFAP